ncbi:MAG: phosphoribosylformylglycinamidine synthase I [Candidatus Diapherotrites archaeon]|nr:phosphoribosylformylglycinamidine synthase I [Candidatus Diapherotrites archaeon]
MKPNVLVLTGYGINCEEETAFAFAKAGAVAKIVHVNDLIKQPKMLHGFQIFAFPGGFSYGDDTGSGNALANKIRNNLWNDLMRFIEKENLVIGICNGFQVIANLGLLPAIGKKYGDRTIALAHNNSATYECRWVRLRNYSKKCVFTKGIDEIRLPVAHGEGKFTAEEKILRQLAANDQIVFKYMKAGKPANGEFPFNPNGAMQDIAGICNESGRILGLMPHPERNIFFTQQDDWAMQKQLLKRSGGSMPAESAGMQIFRNAVNFFI